MGYVPRNIFEHGKHNVFNKLRLSIRGFTIKKETLSMSVLVCACTHVCMSVCVLIQYLSTDIIKSL